MLVVPERNIWYQVYYDTSKEGSGCVLIQQDIVGEYGSRLLKSHEQNYSVYDLESAVVVVFSLK